MKYYWLWLSCTLRPSGPTERLLIDCRLTYLISLIRTVDKHVRFNVINRGYISSSSSSGRLTRH